MELRHIYSIATALSKAFDSEELVGANISDLNIGIEVSPTTLYGIDQEFYRQTHNNSLEGFKHNHTIDAIIDNVHFVLTEKEMDSK